MPTQPLCKSNAHRNPFSIKCRGLYALLELIALRNHLLINVAWCIWILRHYASETETQPRVIWLLYAYFLMKTVRSRIIFVIMMLLRGMHADCRGKGVSNSFWLALYLSIPAELLAQLSDTVEKKIGLDNAMRCFSLLQRLRLLKLCTTGLVWRPGCTQSRYKHHYLQQARHGRLSIKY